MDVRRFVRYVVNIAALVVAVLAAPQFGQLVPESWLPGVGSVVAIVNVILSYLRPLMESPK